MLCLSLVLWRPEAWLECVATTLHLYGSIAGSRHICSACSPGQPCSPREVRVVFFPPYRFSAPMRPGANMFMSMRPCLFVPVCRRLLNHGPTCQNSMPHPSVEGFGGLGNWLHPALGTWSSTAKVFGGLHAQVCATKAFCASAVVIAVFFLGVTFPG